MPRVKRGGFYEKFCLNFLYWNALLNTNIDDAATFAGLKVISKGEKKKKYIFTYIFFHSHFHVKKCSDKYFDKSSYNKIYF